jgi:hypothetical protein
VNKNIQLRGGATRASISPLDLRPAPISATLVSVTSNHKSQGQTIINMYFCLLVSGGGRKCWGQDQVPPTGTHFHLWSAVGMARAGLCWVSLGGTMLLCNVWLHLQHTSQGCSLGTTKVHGQKSLILLANRKDKFNRKRTYRWEEL